MDAQLSSPQFWFGESGIEALIDALAAVAETY
jgi:hypothetical protein